MAGSKARDDRPEANAGLLGRLARTRMWTKASMVLERAWPLVLPLLIVASLFLSLAWFGLFRLMPDWLRIGAASAFGIAAIASLYPLRYFRWPQRAAIDRRIERANELEHTPVLVQADRLTGSADGFAQALWHEHQKRMAEKLGRLSSDLPRTGVPERDPWGLRAVSLLLLVTAFAFSAGPFGGRVADAFRAAPGVPPVPPRVDAWVTPPPYTGKPPIFLTADANRETALFDAPEGSDLTLRVTGGSGQETLTFSPTEGEAAEIAPQGAADPAQAQHTGVRQFSSKLVADGMLVLKSGADEIGTWAFQVVPDTSPGISFIGEPKRAVNGTLELAYRIQDDYGAVSGKAEFEMLEPQASDARPLYDKPDMPLSLPRKAAKDGAAKTSRDLTEHVWAGVPVRATLTATDAAGQVARSEAKEFRMPERPFTNPLARALVEQRRILALDANRKDRVLDLMEGVTLRPEETILNPVHWLAVSSVQSRLKQARSDDDLRGVVDYLWQIALAVEDGDLTAAERRLRQAQEALKNALENNASDEEIEKLMNELRAAMQDFLREFAERAQRDPNMAQQMPQNSQQLRQSDLEKLMDQIEELARSGAKEQAKDLLSQLQDMMNNLQAGRQQQRQQGQGQSEMRQQMDKLGELMRRQQEMMNETHRLDQMQRGQRQRGQDRGEQQGQQGQQGEQQQGQGGPMSAEELAEALRQMQQGQGQLRGDLGEIMKGLEGMGIQPGEGFGEAGEAMGEAGKALGDAQGEQAVGEQGRALEALRKGAQDMMQQMQQAMQGEQGGSEEGGRQQSSDRDPLGRPRATTGPDFGDTVKVPDEIDVQRAREILEAIRKRLGNALSPEIERDYLERLLQMR
ncbi:MAG: TIGR02302 family protein [Mesorhizobium sp.]|nr:TIGR02302 family protein [Mesorhizobium sp.]